MELNVLAPNNAAHAARTNAGLPTRSKAAAKQRPDEDGCVLEVADQHVCRSELFGRRDQTWYGNRVRRTNEGHERGGRGDRHDDHGERHVSKRRARCC